MIPLKELKKIANKSGLTVYQQEKDYLLKLFLYHYYESFEDAVFKGGTCIKFIYGLPRFSEDIDFNIDISPENFQKQIKSIMKKIKFTGIKTYFLKEEKFEQAYTCEIGFHGPLFKGTEQTRNKIRIDAGKRTGTILDIQWRVISSEYPEIKTNFLVKTMHEEEILVEKIISLMNRNKGRDLYDTWFLLEKGVLLNKKLFNKKTNMEFDINNIPTKKEYHRDIEKLTNKIVSYNQILDVLRQKIEKTLNSHKN